MFGLSERNIQTIHSIFNKYPEIETATLFGSRAKGTHKPGSDIDLALEGGNFDIKTLVRLKSDFEESSLPYKVDIIDIKSVSNIDLLDHIARVGVVFYTKGC